MAISISNAVDRPHRAEREGRYMTIVGKYDKAIIDTFPRVMAEVVMELERKPSDVLGQTFHELELHNKARGQYFTPYSVSQMMAHMTVDEALLKRAEDKGFVTAHEPACGSGSMVIALAEAMENKGVNYQQQLHVTAVDIDVRAVHMAYVQMSLMNIPAEIRVGDTLTGEMRDSWFTPAHIFGGWDRKLRQDQGEAIEVAQPETVQQQLWSQHL